MGSLLAALATIIVTGLAALLALPYMVDWNDYKAQFETHAAQLVGRPVRIDGDVDLTILPIPTLSMHGVRIADEFGKFERPFAEVEELDATLSVPQLLSGTIEAKSIELDQPVLRLKIDEFGEGSWQSIGPYGLDIPIPVRDVILDSVDIRDGAIELRRGRQGSPKRIDRISGTFSAEGLSGPFHFSGTGSAGGNEKEIQFAAGKLQPDASVRFKASLRSDKGVSLYQLDGDLKGLGGAVRYVGPVIARLALDAKAKKAEPGQLGDPAAGKAVEMRANAKITLDDAKFDNIALTVTQNDRPQSVTGSAYASWGTVPKLDMDLEASWLDLDQILGSSQKDSRPTPVAAIAALPNIFQGWSFTPRQGQINAKIQQAGLGGDVIEQLDFSASHDAGGWKVDHLTARLPGDTDVDVQGTLPAGNALAFGGNFTLNGKNLSRLLRWAAPSLGVVDTGSDQTFSLSSKMALTPDRLAFEKAKGSLGESSFSFDLVHDYGKDSKLLLALESQRLDLRGLYGGQKLGPAGPPPDDAALPPAQPSKTPAGPPPDDAALPPETVPAHKTSLPDVLWTVFKAEESSVSLLISQLQLPDFEARDVRSAFRYENGTFDIKELNLATTDGLKVKADGRITGFDTKPNGSLNLSIDAPSAQSVTNLARLGGLDSMSPGTRRRIDALAPFRLSGTLDAEARQSLLKLTLAGNAAGSELTLTGRLTGDLGDLKAARVDVNGLIGNADGRRLIAQLAPEVPLNDAANQNGAGYLKVSALGAMKSGLTSKIELQTPQARGEFEGLISPLDKPSWCLNGKLNLRAAHAATALSMLRLSPGGVPVTGAIDLSASVLKKASAVNVADLSLRIGGETIRGKADLDLSGDRPSAKIDINAGTVSLPKIAAYLVDWDRQDLTSQIATIANGGGGVWANQAFALAALQAGDGTLKLKARSIAFSDDLKVSDGQLDASLQGGTLKVSQLGGKLYGGSVAASGSLKALEGRADFDAKLKADDVDLAAFSRAHGGNELAKGSADLDLSLQGQGFSPRGLISVISGDGKLKLSGGTLYGLSPAVLEKAATTYLTQEIPDKDKLAAKLDKEFRQGSLRFEPVSASVSIKDGVARISNAVLKGHDYRADADVTIDLASLRVDSEWQITHTKKTDDGQVLPPVRLVFAGPLTGFSALKPILYTDQFERFLTIKRMDQDMDKLEKLDRQRNQSHAPSASRSPAKPAPASNASASSAPQPGAPNAPAEAIPTQSLLHAPPMVLDGPGSTTTPAKAPPTQETTGTPAAPKPAPTGGWSTGTETSTDTPADGSWRADPQLAQPSASSDFEAKIREVLRTKDGSNTTRQ